LRFELPPDPLNVAQHPQLDDFAVAVLKNAAPLQRISCPLGAMPKNLPRWRP
jgi:hypothetical protein